MFQGVTVLGERKYRVGVTSVFEWVAPEPITGDPSGAAKLSTGDVDLTLAAVHAPISVTGFAGAAGDRREFTVIAGGSTDGLQGRYGAAFLVTPHDGSFPVTVTRIDDTSAFIADALPHDVSISVADPAELQFATYLGTVPAASVAAALARDVAWEVLYEAKYGSDAPTLTGGRDFGLLHIVNQPFDTGLSPSMLVRHVAHLGDLTPRGQQDWTPQLQSGLEELILAIRQELAPKGKTEDDIPVAAQLRIAHLSYTLANIYDLSELETALRLRAQATERMRAALRLIWVDDNNDGVPDEGEVQQVTRARTSWARGGSPAPATYTRPFSIGMKH